jgi:hypothetical protein
MRFNARIRTIVVLTGGKLTGIYFLYLLSVIYFAVTTHLRQGKKVSILVPGDVDSGPVASRRGLLEAVPINLMHNQTYCKAVIKRKRQGHFFAGCHTV